MVSWSIECLFITNPLVVQALRHMDGLFCAAACMIQKTTALHSLPRQPSVLASPVSIPEAAPKAARATAGFIGRRKTAIGWSSSFKSCVPILRSTFSRWARPVIQASTEPCGSATAPFPPDTPGQLATPSAGGLVLCEDRDLLHRITPQQWRPMNIRARRERVARQAIQALPKSQRRHGLRVRRMVRLIDTAEDRCQAGALLEAISPLAQALLIAPATLTPL